MTNAIAPAALQPAMSELARSLPVTTKVIAQIKTDPTASQRTDHEIRWAATAQAIRLHHKVLNLRSPKPGSVISALRRLANLTGVEPEMLVLAWSGLRALVAKGEELTQADTGNPAIAAILETAGIQIAGIPATANFEVARTATQSLKIVLVQTPIVRKPLVLDFRLGRQVMLLTDTDSSGATISAKDDAAIEAALGQFKVPAPVAAKAKTPVATTPTAAKTLAFAVPPLTIKVKAWATTAIRSSLFEPYSPQRLDIPGAKDHPTELVESAALASVALPTPTYRPHLPQRLVTSGVLSIAQLETIVYGGQAHATYLEADPDSGDRLRPRQGFFLGDGTGAGKGRQCAGMILDNFNQGRRKAVWISEVSRLLIDAQRDWQALGGHPNDVFDQGSFRPKESIVDRSGILFSTYAMIRGDGDNSHRVDQIVEWLGDDFDGILLFDEVQNARNAGGQIIKEENSQRTKSLQGMAVLALQHRLPHARVVYVSATGASSVQDLAYAPRLGLWGPGTPFNTVGEFCHKIDQGGIAALELVTTSLKALGLYVSRHLSFAGIQYDEIEHQLTDEQLEEHDAIAVAWRKLEVTLRTRLRTAEYQAVLNAQKKGIRLQPRRGLSMSSLGGARERFYAAYHAALSLPSVIEHMQQALTDGKSCVLQVTNTFQAMFERSISGRDPSASDDNIDMTPRDIPIGFLEEFYPIYCYEVQQARDPVTGKTYAEYGVVFDAQGKPVIDPEALAEREALAQAFRDLRMPEGPLEAIIATFGSSNVAEVTGRTRRLVTVDGIGTSNGGSASKMIEDRNPAHNSAEVASFQNGEKTILIYSTAAGGAGGSYHADRTVRNRAQRFHYVLQPGYRADQAIQGLGRTNRTNQAEKPHYFLVRTNLASQRKAISRISRRLAALGALSLGQRQTTSTLFDARDNLSTSHAKAGWRAFLSKVALGRYAHITLTQFQQETGLEIATKNGQLLPLKDLPDIDRFLARLTSVEAGRQAELYNTICEEIEEALISAVRDSSFDNGVSTITAKSIMKLDDRVVYVDPRTGATARYVHLLRLDDKVIIPFDQAARNGAAMRTAYYRDRIFNTVHVIHSLHGDQYEDVTPTRRRIISWTDLMDMYLSASDRDQVKQMWEAELAAANKQATETEMHLITGTLLKIWDAIKAPSFQVVRVQTDEGENILGRLVDDRGIAVTIDAITAKQSGNNISPESALSAVDLDKIVNLDNGWVLRKWWTASQSMIEIVIRQDQDLAKAELAPLGVTVEEDPAANPSMRFFLPVDPTQRLQTLEAIAQRHGLASIV